MTTDERLGEAVEQALIEDGLARPAWAAQLDEDYQRDSRLLAVLCVEGVNCRKLFELIWVAGFTAGEAVKR